MRGMPRSLLALLLAGSLAAQTPPPPQQDAVVIKSTTRLVQVSVVVHGKKGEPVADLKKEDFVLYDKGQEQKIKLFAMETSHASVEPVPEKLPEGVIANRVWVSSSDKKVSTLPNAVTVILLDGLNTHFTDQHQAKQALIKFLQQIRPGDRVALYSLGNGLKVLHDFTTDTASLLAALERYKSGIAWQLDASTATDPNTGDDAMDAFLNAGEDKINAFYAANRVNTTLGALTTIANHLAGMAGRKNLIWLSGGFSPLVGLNPDGSLGQDFQSFSEPLQRTLRALGQVGVAIYPVDARGLVGFTALNPSMSASSRGNINQRGPSRADMAAQQNLFHTQSTMREIAERTGGRAFMNTNDITGAIRQAMNDTEVSYSLVFSPSHDEWNGKFRDLKIKVNRPGVDVRYRKGYYATADLSNEMQVRQAAVLGALNSPLVSTGLGLLAKVVTQPTKEAPNAHINLVVETKDIDFNRNDKNLWVSAVDVLMVVRDDQDHGLKELSKTLRLGLTQEQYDNARKTGIGATIMIDVPPKATHIRTVVRDVGNGAVGSLDIPVGL